jgi:hypothetical protein
MGMEVRADQISLAGRWAEDSDDFGLKADIVAEEELSRAIADLRLWLDPFLLVGWVREEAEALGCSARMPEMFDQSVECSPKILLSVLAILTQWEFSAVKRSFGIAEQMALSARSPKASSCFGRS